MALAAPGPQVGLLDADIYGPTLPQMLGAGEQAAIARARQHRSRCARWGLKAMSIGFLVEEETPMIWRGPMVMGALEQFMGQVEWGELDFLVVDMPPGTGDAQLTMAQRGAAGRRGDRHHAAGRGADRRPPRRARCSSKVERARPRRGREHELLLLPELRPPRRHLRPWRRAGRGGERLGVEFLGEVPLKLDIRAAGRCRHADRRLAAPETEEAAIYRAIAARLWAKLNAAEVPAAPRFVVE